MDMSDSRWRWAPSMLFAMLVLSAPPASAIGGSATIDAKELLKLRGCGREKGTASVQLLLQDDGRWSLTGSALTLGGPYVAGGRGDRKLTLTLDDDAPLRAYLEARLMTKCGEAVTGIALDPKKLLAKLNRRGTKVSLAIVHRIDAPERQVGRRSETARPVAGVEAVLPARWARKRLPPRSEARWPSSKTGMGPVHLGNVG